MSDINASKVEIPLYDREDKNWSEVNSTYYFAALVRSGGICLMGAGR